MDGYFLESVMKILVHPLIFKDKMDEVRKACSDLEIEIVEYDKNANIEIMRGNRVDLNDEYIEEVFGPINMVSSIQTLFKNDNNVYYSFGREVHQYNRIQALFGGHLLNTDGVLVFGQNLADEVAPGDNKFVKPNHCLKVVEAFAATDSTAEEQLNTIAKCHGESLFWVFDAAEIKNEWRFFIDTLDREIIDGCSYRIDGGINGSLKPSADVVEYVRRMLTDTMLSNCDRVLCVDICETSDGKFSVVEANAFSTSGWYEAHDASTVFGYLKREVWVSDDE